MAISKIILNGVTQIDLTQDTVAANNLVSPNTAHGADGNSITGSYVPTGGGGSTLITKTITQNGTYNASSDNADGYSSVTVNTPDAYSIDEVQNTSGTTAVIVGDESGGSTPSATQHIVHLEYADSTSENIYVYYNDSMFSTMITADVLTTHSGKTVTLAQLDGVAWYELSNIPLNTQLVDYNDVVTERYVNEDGSIVTGDPWQCVTDYITISPTMTFSFAMVEYALMGFYDVNKNAISTIQAHDYADTSQDYFSHGTLDSSVIPSNAVYIVLTGNSYSLVPERLSLIRTA